ncbi:MAG: hypothetical protein H6907_10380 [Hyphomicrobiales bacterium]|nr:hypothetical protein [Hyphomicrobiales bacterium]MCP5372126.1 hypothetical protein [Hyphomicrobiales bacterium]
MHRATRLLAVALLCATAAACQSITKVDAGKPVKVGDSFRVHPQIAWNRIEVGGDEMWTVHGPLLHYMRFIKAIDDGDPLFKVKDSGSKDVKAPVYRKGMSPLEVAELFETTQTMGGAQKVKVSGVRPQVLGGRDGFRFDYAYATKGGLLKDGFAVGFEKDGKLRMILFEGAHLHYFPAYRERAEKMIETIEVL